MNYHIQIINYYQEIVHKCEVILTMTNQEFNKIVCTRIKMLRKAKNLSIEKLAYQSGVAKGGLSEIERNKKEPRAFTILKLCAGLNITISEFFDFDEINNFSKKL